MSGALLKIESVTDFQNMFNVYYKDTRITLTDAVLGSFLLSTFNMFWFPGVFSKATCQKVVFLFYFIFFCIALFALPGIFQEIYDKSMMQVLSSKIIVCSIYSKNLKFYEKRFHQTYSSEVAVCRGS